MNTTRVLRRTMSRYVALHYRPDRDTYASVDVEGASDVRFETCLPVRTFAYGSTQEHTPGLFWSATTGTHIPYESRLERSWMLEADFDTDVVGISSQPFTIEHVAPDNCWAHTPDLFLRYADCTARVRDVKNPSRLNDPAVVEQAARTAELCDEIGWFYDMVGVPDLRRTANLDWLSAYRRLFTPADDMADRIMTLCRTPLTIDEVCYAVGSREAALPVLFHLAWTQRIGFDLTGPMTARTLFTTREGGPK